MKHSQLRVRYALNILSKPICSAEDSYRYLLQVWDKSLMNVQEQVYILYLNNSSEVICWRCLNTGNGNQTLFDIKLALACGLNCLASQIIIAHNHPSGILKATPGDIQITNQLHMAASFMDIKLLDHLIITRKGYLSFIDSMLLNR